MPRKKGARKDANHPAPDAANDELRFTRRGKGGKVRTLVAQPMSPAFKMFFHLKATDFRHKAGDPDCATCARIRAEIQRDIEAAGKD